MKTNKKPTAIFSKIKNLPKKIKKRHFAFIIAILLLLVSLFYFKNQFVAALVNGQPIWRLTLIRELEKQAGKQALDSLITRTLILQEAKKQKITVSKEEVDQEIKEIEDNLTQQGQDFARLLEVQGMTRNDLAEQIKIQKLIEKLVGKDIEVSDKEVDEYISQNKDLIPKDSEPEETKASVKEQLRQQKLSDKVTEWLDSLQQNAKINYF
jgi:foldase protein PrsA